jgi:uncharacterized membrane protein YhaH (DUF805 family)
MASDDDAKRKRMNVAMTEFLAMHEPSMAKDAKSVPRAPKTPAPAPAAGWYPHPTMIDTRRYWDGAAWTDHIAPSSPSLSPMGAPAARASASGPVRVETGRDDPSIAWVLALVPLLWLPFDYFSPEFSASGIALVISISVCAALGAWDARRLRDRGFSISGTWALLLVPVYLIERTKRAQSTPLIPIAWFLGFAIAILGSFTFAATYSFDDWDEAAIEEKLNVSGGAYSLECPEETVSDGDRVWCTLFSEGESAELVVDIIRAGSEFSYEWQVYP